MHQWRERPVLVAYGRVDRPDGTHNPAADGIGFVPDHERVVPSTERR
jgi:hypothetical protein